MIKDFQLYHGAVFTNLIHGDIPINIKIYEKGSNAAYVLNDSVGLYIKHTKSRMTPWPFTFKQEHQDEIRQMKDTLNEVFLVLVCGKDGIVALSFKELKNILDKVHEDTEWLRVSRHPGKMYTISGSDGKLKHKVGDNKFPDKILASLSSI